MGEKPKKIQIVVIEDNRLLREALSAMLLPVPDMKVVAADGSGDRLLETLARTTPDIALLDLGPAVQPRLEVVESVVRKIPSTRLIMMDIDPSQSVCFDFARAGVSGFILTDATTEDFLATIRTVAGGGTVLPPRLTGSLFDQISEGTRDGPPKKSPKLINSTHLSSRERECVMLVADGLSNKEIAQKLHLSTSTVKSHIHNILQKMTLNSRVQIAKYAHTNGGFAVTKPTNPTIKA